MSATTVSPGAWQTLVRGISLSPTLRNGLPGTVALALIATAGRAIVPIAIQRTIDEGIGTSSGVDLAATGSIVAWAGVAVLMTAMASGGMNWRLTAVVESALSDLRVNAFRHIHDLSMLHQQSQQRGVLVSRVTTDIDEISRFMQWAGLNLIASLGQLTVATVVMLAYSWQLALVVLGLFLPFAAFGRVVQRRLTVAYAIVRENLGRLLGVVSETVVGAPVVRAYGIEKRTQHRLDTAIATHRSSALRVGKWVSGFSASGEVFGAVATSAVVVVGVHLGVAGEVTTGTVVAFLFLITLFVDPVLIMGEVINEGQTAVAGWRRVLDVLDVEPDVVDPSPAGRDVPSGRIGARFAGVWFEYPSAPDPDFVPSDAVEVDDVAQRWALRDVSIEIGAGEHVAVVGETGSGKTTFAKLLTRLMDPTLGTVEIGDVDVRQLRFSSLRRKVVMVPQEGMLLSGTIADNVRMGLPAADAASRIELNDAIRSAFDSLGLEEWFDELPDGMATEVGERGGNLSAGERQLVALARAYVADPAVLVLDEATSAVDPATEVRLQRALYGLSQGRTTVTIAHRLSTAERADRILVFDGGQLVADGPHAELARKAGVYRDLYRSWTSTTGSNGH
ncbi:MAG: ABC transporter ATP-binding protein [Nitriliruptoraceae bacterium]